jgi:3'(2'), 5'-bisphosphate nucleotidase
MPDYSTLSSAAHEAVFLAALVTREVQAALEDLRAITKDDKSPVTVADFAAQAVVAWVLRERLGPTVILVGEEDSKFLRDPDHTTHRQATLAAVQAVWPDATEEALLDAIDIGAGDTHHAGFWTLDPVDGTKGFLRNQQYAIALAYIERGTPTIGVLGCPNLPRKFSRPLDLPDPHGTIYAAIKGDGVFEYAADEHPTNSPNKPTQITRLDHDDGDTISVCASVEKAHSNADDTDHILEYLSSGGLQGGPALRAGSPSFPPIPTAEPARLDSQAKYAVTARGQADAYLRLPTKKNYIERIWDHAAGSLIATEAGCFVTDIHGNALDFSHGRGLEKNKGIICAPPRVHGLVIGAIEALGIGADA